MVRKPPKRCDFCYKRLNGTEFDHYYSGKCTKARDDKKAKPVGVRKRKGSIQNQIPNTDTL